MEVIIWNLSQVWLNYSINFTTQAMGEQVVFLIWPNINIFIVGFGLAGFEWWIVDGQWWIDDNPIPLPIVLFN